MAEYVEVNQLLSDMGEDDPKDVALYIAEYQKADVVEREEYEMMAERCKAMTNAFVELQRDNKDLRFRIDKAIKEIDKAKMYRGNPRNLPNNIGLDRYFDKGLTKALKILKRNLEDIDF